jgi:hypothetical protein
LDKINNNSNLRPKPLYLDNNSSSLSKHLDLDNPKASLVEEQEEEVSAPSVNNSNSSNNLNSKIYLELSQQDHYLDNRLQL